jgi:nucleoside-diphosphate-sugar epimerase
VEKFVIVGVGATGRAVAKALRGREAEVILVSRSGGGADLPGTQVARGDAADAHVMAQVAAGATAIFNCANPPYDKWLTDWPPVAASLLEAATRSGAVLTTLSNLYAYGPPTAPMTPHDPLVSTLPKAQVRATMWRDALAAHERGDLRATEVRASDFIGHGSQSIFERALPQVAKGRTATVYGDVDQLHSWTYTGDVGRTLVAAATTEAAWGRPWHAVTNEPATMRSVLSDMASALGAPSPKVRSLPNGLLKAIGLVSPLIGELPKVAYQFERPFVIDDHETRTLLDLEPTPWSEVIADAVGR